MNWLHNNDIEQEIYALIDEYRTSCLWSFRSDFIPASFDEIMLVLSSIEKHGDRNGFIRAGKVKKWLLQNSNAESAN